jgi:hypothetical protein
MPPWGLDVVWGFVFWLHVQLPMRVIAAPCVQVEHFQLYLLKQVRQQHVIVAKLLRRRHGHQATKQRLTVAAHSTNQAALITDTVVQ